MMSDRGEDDDEFNQVFGRQNLLRDEIYNIKNDNPNMNDFDLHQSYASKFSDNSWDLLGQYISTNTHLEGLKISRILNDDTTPILFTRLLVSISDSVLMAFEAWCPS